MPGHYTLISEEEMRTYLEAQGFTEVFIDGTVEIVYSKVIAKRTCLRVFTSVAHGQGRECGEDAIRVAIVYRKKDGGIVGVGSTTRVNRIETWKKNLQKRLNKYQQLMSPDCPLCASPMRLRNGAWGEFWGCVEYPDCTGLVKIQ